MQIKYGVCSLANITRVMLLDSLKHISLYLKMFMLDCNCREASIIMHEDFMEAINVVAAKKKGSLDYYA